VLLFECPSDDNTVFISGFHQKTTVEDLVLRLVVYGPLCKAKIIDKTKDEESEPSQSQRRSSIFAVAKFYSYRQAREAVSGLNGITLHGNRLSFRFMSVSKTLTI
jgi:hypothetical protein